MSESGENVNGSVDHGNEYEDPAQEQELRADLEEIWQGESPSTARRTEFADEVDGRLGTRHRLPGDPPLES